MGIKRHKPEEIVTKLLLSVIKIFEPIEPVS